MYPKPAIENLNRRRAANARLRFARTRILETVAEAPLARGKVSQLPKGLKTPPAFALEAARLATSRWLRALEKLTPEAIKRDPAGAVREMMGVYDAVTAAAREIPKDIPQELRKTAEGKGMCELVEAITPESFRRYLVRLEEALNAKLPKPTHGELVARADRYRRGLTETFSPDAEGGVVGGQTLLAQLYYLIWFFWPKLVSKRQLRATDLKDFFAAETGMQFSLKLTEKAFTDVGLARRIVPE